VTLKYAGFWRACDGLGWPFGPICKLLLLTAQRRTEVAGMRWSEIDLKARTWTIPRERTKNDREHLVHLSDLAFKIIEGLPRFSQRPPNGVGESPVDLVFTTTGERHVSGYSKAKRRLNALMLDVMRDEFVEGGKASQLPAIGEWILHDLRRSAATGMAKLNVPPHVVDRILNHVSGTIRGIAAVYNRHAYLDEGKAALEAWGQHVQTLLDPPIDTARLAPRGAGLFTTRA
jgi:integrase